VYCCKQYSSAWRRDIVEHGSYAVETEDDRFVLSSRDKVLNKISQKDIIARSSDSGIISEIVQLANSPSLRELDIAGGEPLLYNGIVPLLSAINTPGVVRVWTGLGVSASRLQNVVSALKGINHDVVVSAETTGSLYEFVRYGNTWTRFNSNLSLIRDTGLTYSFNSVISNLTLFGFSDFINTYSSGAKEIRVSLCNSPSFLNGSVMDEDSKNLLLKQKDCFSDSQWSVISALIETVPSSEERSKLREYLLDFAARRNLSLNVFPESFIKWVTN
jgi:hypothetical protein